MAHRPLRVLDFDIENRPLSYLGSDYTTAEITAIAWAWTDQPNNVEVRLLGQCDLPNMLADFCKDFAEADVVTGHYIRGHDLLVINLALTEFGMPALTDKYVQDTKIDLMVGKGLSRSQESLAAMLGLESDKVHMTQNDWREANRLTKEGLRRVRNRVTGDVKQHIEMRQKLLDCGYLGPPRLWRSRSHKPLAKYAP